MIRVAFSVLLCVFETNFIFSVSFLNFESFKHHQLRQQDFLHSYSAHLVKPKIVCQLS